MAALLCILAPWIPRHSGRTLGKTPGGQPMKPNAIISRGQSLQILINDLRKAALERRATELKDATPERRGTILAEIEQDVRNEMLRRSKECGHHNVIY